MNSETLQAIILSIAEARSLDETLRLVVEGIASEFDLALARLWLIEPDQQCPVCSTKSGPRDLEAALHLRASRGRSIQTNQLYSETHGAFHKIPLGQRKIGQVGKSGKPLLIAGVTGHEDWVADRDWVVGEGIRSFAGQPLIFRGEILGVLAVFSRTTFSETDFAWLKTFADHAAVAIGNAKTLGELEDLRRRLEAENEYLQEELKGNLHPSGIVGDSAALKKVLEQVSLVAVTNASVLIQGESGTGKELIARAIHEQSPRRNRPFIKVNCGAIPGELFESEFFGHVKGAFTGAIKDRAGRFELADSGVIFLDEVGEIPLNLQAKLLRVLQEKQFERVGESRTRTLDVRVIAATNRDLRSEVEAGRFREDLFYRLTVFPIELPPLRNRKDDIPFLAAHFLERSIARLGMRHLRLTRENILELQRYDWPGNIRELENVIERAAILAQRSGRLFFQLDFQRSNTDSTRVRPAKTDATAPKSVLTRDQLRIQEVENIQAALNQSGGKIFGPGGAAEILGMRPTTLASRLKALGFKKEYFPRGQNV